jgi:hypothetical protein
MYRRGQCHHRGGLMILPWAHRLISAGAHGLRRIPGQSVNLAHLLFGAHHAPRPLCLRATRCTPGGFPRGAMGVGGSPITDPSTQS